jgi:hypothetical protein
VTGGDDGGGPEKLDKLTALQIRRGHRGGHCRISTGNADENSVTIV